MTDFKTQPVPDPIAPAVPPAVPTKKPRAEKPNPQTEFTTKAVPDGAVTAPAEVPPFTPADQHRVRQFLQSNKWYLLAMLVGLVIIGVLAFFAFRPQKQEPTQKAKVNLEFDAPEIAPASGDTIYKLRLKNSDTVKLVGAQLELLYADGMSYVSSTPKADNLAGSVIKIPDLPPGTEIPIVLKVALQGDVNSELKLIARLNYQYDKFVSMFTEEASHTVRLTASNVILDFTGPNALATSQPATYDLYYRNNSDEEIPKGRIVMTYPNSFVFEGSDPKPTMGQNTWDVGTVKSQEGGKITIRGNFKTAEQGSSYEFAVDFQAQDQKGDYHAQATIKHETTITNQPLSVNHRVVSGVRAGVVAPGDEITYEIDFRNNSPVVATGVLIEAELNSAAINPAATKVDGGALRDNVLVWNASSLPQLASLGPSDSGNLRFTVKVNNPATTDAQTNLTVVTKVRIKSNEERLFLPGNEQTVKVSSPASLIGSVQHAGGPLPLRVGQQSSFQVTLEVRNNSNELTKAVLTGVIPIGVNVDLNSIGGEEKKAVKYDPATGKFSWDIGGVPAHSGRLQPARKLTLNLSTVPSVNQVYDSPVLLRGISLAAKDSFTEQGVALKIEDLTTGNLPGYDGLGRVEP